ncbi:phospholipid-transporting ATPase 3 isoform X2 [Cryptomeria japonica]|uniref:phospholipid-transporting ATPase 3 isoform X2 n=1 Tax=Cryptomeria japonica TaxID=3369 RepID=UPI0025AD5DC9|nr:phospholipid-transporting ATPase 3 isoform X2 [Cryptomeria japonica]
MDSIWESKERSLKRRIRLDRSSEELGQQGYRRVICNDPQANAPFNYRGNSISTTKYNLFTFLPKGLFEQFRRVANVYFLFVAILSLAPFSAVQSVTNIFPLVLVLSISLSKEAFEDWRRFKNDRKINSSFVEVLEGDTWVQTTWSKLVVGSIVKIKSKEYFPADMLLLSSSNDEGLCYIETSNLDGESNLKTRRALENTWKYATPYEARNFRGEIHCEHPNDLLYTFTGNLVMDEETFPISTEQILLRQGCSLQNTSWIIGIVTFTGHETKVMMNALNVPSKRSRLDKKIDILIYFLFGMLFVMSMIGGISCVLFINPQLWYLELQIDTGDIFSASPKAMVGVLMTLSLITLYNTIIPVSLYVSIEIIKFFQSTQFINKDLNMYHEETNMGAQARTSNLNDELGQVEYIFSDKTGTLTQNVMEFCMCSIGGIIYGSSLSDDQRSDTYGMRIPSEQLHVNRPKCEFYEKGFNFCDQRLMGGAWRNEENPEVCKEFFRCLAVCHSALPDEESTSKEINYQVSSPDEAALVVAAKNLGFFFHRRTTTSVIVRESHVQGLGSIQDVEYKILNVLEFSSSRKRQSVICAHPSGQLILYCKGADTAIYQRLEDNKSPIAVATWNHLRKFASEGLRTLCVAYRFLDFSMYQSWNAMFQEARSSLTDREQRIHQVAELIEEQLILLGCVAIEDKLQDGVPTCIHTLLQAGIKIWVLTGDKMETAINVGYACGLIDANRRQLVISSDTKGDSTEVEIKDWVKQNLVFYLEDGKEHRITNGNNTTLVIDGKCLEYALESDLHESFFELSCQCFSVICCRVTPLQKAQVTTLIRYNARKVTLSIGDGANDVSMIQAAHIGVAVRGQEGMQAVMASDFAISQFRFLTDLLLVHGRLSYVRISKVVTYFFYKNILLTLTQFWFTLFCGYSSTNFYDDWYQSLYNVLFTSLPVFAIGIFDQDVSPKISKQCPQLYKTGIENLYFRWQLLGRWLFFSIFQSFIIFYFSILTGFSGKRLGKILGQWDVGTLAFSSVVIAVNFRLLIGNSFLTLWHFASILGSFVVWIIFLIFYTSIYSIWDFEENVYGQLLVPISTLDFWFILCLSPVAVLAADLAFEGFQRIFMPYDYQIIQDEELSPTGRNDQQLSKGLRAWLLQPS